MQFFDKLRQFAKQRGRDHHRRAGAPVRRVRERRRGHHARCPARREQHQFLRWRARPEDSDRVAGRRVPGVHRLPGGPEADLPGHRRRGRGLLLHRGVSRARGLPPGRDPVRHGCLDQPAVDRAGVRAGVPYHRPRRRAGTHRRQLHHRLPARHAGRRGQRQQHVRQGPGGRHGGRAAEGRCHSRLQQRAHPWPVRLHLVPDQDQPNPSLRSSTTPGTTRSSGCCSSRPSSSG